MKQTAFGSLIQTLRKQNQLTQAALAEKVGVTDKAVSKWERGLSYPDISLLPTLADVLGVTVDDLLKECLGKGQVSRLTRIFEMSHDIRTPLHIILGCVEMAEANPDDKERLMHYLESIRSSGEDLLQQIDLAMRATYLDSEEIVQEEQPADPDDYLEKHDPDQEMIREQYDFSGKRILVAEDMALNREIAGEILKQTGAEVDFARDGEVCLKKIQDAPAGYYDLVLMDIMMPGMDGIEATRRIRQLRNKKKASVPIIALTANVYEKDREAAIEAGMDAFTEKPIFTEKLFAAIKEYF